VVPDDWARPSAHVTRCLVSQGSTQSGSNIFALNHYLISQCLSLFYFRQIKLSPGGLGSPKNAKKNMYTSTSKGGGMKGGSGAVRPPPPISPLPHAMVPEDPSPPPLQCDPSGDGPGRWLSSGSPQIRTQMPGATKGTQKGFFVCFFHHAIGFERDFRIHRLSICGSCERLSIKTRGTVFRLQNLQIKHVKLFNKWSSITCSLRNHIFSNIDMTKTSCFAVVTMSTEKNRNR